MEEQQGKLKGDQLSQGKCKRMWKINEESVQGGGDQPRQKLLVGQVRWGLKLVYYLRQ